MIIIVKASEIDSVIDKIGDIEERFWINYRNYQKENREFIKERFEEIYKELECLKSENQMEMEI